MKAEKPAKGISKIDEFCDGTVAYRIECECSNNDCAVDNWVELHPESDVKSITVLWYAKMYSKFWEGNRWAQIKNGLKLIFTGQIEMAHDMMISEQTALNWISALEQSIEDLKADEN